MPPTAMRTPAAAAGARAPATPATPQPAAPAARTARPTPAPALRLTTRPASGRGGGQPIDPAIRPKLEQSLGVDLSAVRVHSDAHAQRVATEMSARAVTYGSDIFLAKGERGSDIALIGHEVAHVVQQQATPAAQGWTALGGDHYEHEAQRASDAVVRGEAFTVESRTSTPRVQRLGISDALDFFARQANNIPGFRMFTIILGVNPINMSRVERSAANVMRAVVEFIPGGGLITQALDNYGIFERAGAWVEQQINTLGMTGTVIRTAVMDFVNSLSLSDIFDLDGVWERAKRIFTAPIRRIIDFVVGLVTGILRFIKDAILMPLARLAEGTRGYDLLKAVLGQDPITGEPVPRNAETLIGGFMKLIGQEEVWENIKRGNAIARAWAWFQGALQGLMGFVRQIPQLFISALQSLEIADLVLVPRAFSRIASVFGGFVLQFLSWAGQQVMTLLQIIFEVVAPSVMPYIQRAAGAFRTIVADPIRFIGNLVRAGIQGFRQFASNFLTHLRTSLIQWLTGTLSGANIYIPQAFTIREIIKFVLSVLGLTWQNIRAKLVRATSETVVTVLETTFDIVVTLVREGPAAAWDKIREQLTNLREMVMEQIMNFVMTRIVQAAITRLVTSLNPAGAFIQAIIAIYNTIMFLVERLRQIAQVVGAFIDSIAAIAAGNIASAANRVEQTMGGLLTLVISFLARLLGLGRVSDAVTNIVNRIRAPIDRALDRVVAWIVATARRIGSAVVRGARSAVARLVNWATMRQSFRASGQNHSLLTREVNGRPTLMIATEEMTFADYLAGLTVPASDSARSGAKTNAISAHARINTKLTELKTLETAAGAAPTSAQRGEMTRKQEEIRREYGTLAPLVQTLGIGGVRPETVVTDVRPSSGSKLQQVEAKPLTALRGNTTGNPNANSVRGVPGWSFLDQINIARNNDNTVYNDWVRWHLIHSGLHGPAAVFNLVAAPRGVNSRFAGQVEQPVLRLVLQPGTLLYYKANVEYGNSAPPLNDFPTAITYNWGRMRLNEANEPVEEGALGGPVRFDGFPTPVMPGGTGPQTIRLKNAGRPFMENVLSIPHRAARRIAAALAANSGVGVHAAMNAYYALPTSLSDGTPYSAFLEADRNEIEAARTRTAGRYVIDLS